MIKKLLFSCLLAATAVPGTAQSLDATFGNGGTRIYNDLGSFYDAEVAADGKIILPGNYYANDVSAMLVRFNTDGTLDTGFSGDGKYEINQFSDPNYYEEFYNARVLPDGKLLVMYYYEFDNGTTDFSSSKLMRFNTNGTVDNTFNSPATTGGNYYESFEVLPNGKILAVGNNALHRLMPNGAIDTSYGTNGVRPLNFEFWQIYVTSQGIFFQDYVENRMVKMPNEDSSVFTYYDVNSSFNYKLKHGFLYLQVYDGQEKIIKLDQNLQPVASFGSAGVFTVPVGMYFELSEVQENGSILSVTRTYNPGTGNTAVDIVRINPNGTLDLTFGNQGTFTQNYDGEYWSYSFYHPTQKKLYVWNEIDNSMDVLVSRFNLPQEQLAVANSAAKTAVRVLQNPVSDILKLSAKLDNAQVYSAAGGKTAVEFSGDQVSVANLRTGLYLVSGKDVHGNTVTLKFVKN